MKETVQTSHAMDLEDWDGSRKYSSLITDCPSSVKGLLFPPKDMTTEMSPEVSKKKKRTANIHLQRHFWHLHSLSMSLLCFHEMSLRACWGHQGNSPGHPFPSPTPPLPWIQSTRTQQSLDPRAPSPGLVVNGLLSSGPGPGWTWGW